ncbi:uncharacterized protein LOC106763332 [Vigna radiata var. radiata]|uniref:Uncharacterized protein LOC106763332 n=1 Tax=Vigna radiata var. radiata TaxID=3916 RepID=A0A1S3UAM3_VIGRR|nr:uncharacterized protein LOC106763332 [Vigna radiata var. radiata]
MEGIAIIVDIKSPISSSHPNLQDIFLALRGRRIKRNEDVHGCGKDHDSHRIHAIHIDDLEIERQLQFLNKPPRKSIQTEFGYIVDCVDIYKQPAFGHPLLKEHKLQRKPSFQNPFENTSVNNSSNEFIFGLQKEKCPKRTVPIRRTIKDDLIQRKSSIYSQSLVQDVPGLHLAELYVNELMGPFYQVKGISSVYNPRVLKKNVNQESLSHIWVENDHGTNKIAFGWHVAPLFHGRDTGTYIFAAWTTDNFNHTGCYNQQCQGFVQTNRAKFLGARFPKTSVYGGTTTEITISITVVEFRINYVVVLV